jgi:hypothetical protein
MPNQQETQSVQTLVRARDTMQVAWDKGIDLRDNLVGDPKAAVRRAVNALESALIVVDTTMEELGVSDAPNYTAIGVADIPWKPTHRHLKTGGLYRVLLLGTSEADMEPVVIYDNRDGRVWVRPENEFFDGRFVTLLEADDAAE